MIIERSNTMLKQYGFYKGVNLGGWFSQCDYSDERLDTFITEPDFKGIAAWGVDHVRIPADYNIVENEDGTWNEKGFARLEHAFALAKKYNLHVVLDLHKTPGFSFDEGENEAGLFDSDELQARFYRLWEEFAKRFGDRPDEIAFELLNEVTNKEFQPAWNRIIKEIVPRIRKFAPKTLILIGGYDNNAAWAVPALDAPADDRIVFNFHCYEPLVFTHQGATWTDKIDPAKRMAFEDSETCEQYFEDLIADAVATAKKYNVPLYCGEYGVIDRVNGEDTLKWYQCIHKVLERHNIGRCAWTYKELDFGLTDTRLDTVRREVVQSL